MKQFKLYFDRIQEIIFHPNVQHLLQPNSPKKKISFQEPQPELSIPNIELNNSDNSNSNSNSISPTKLTESKKEKIRQMLSDNKDKKNRAKDIAATMITDFSNKKPRKSIFNQEISKQENNFRKRLETKKNMSRGTSTPLMSLVC